MGRGMVLITKTCWLEVLLHIHLHSGFVATSSQHALTQSWQSRFHVHITHVLWEAAVVL